MNGHTDGGDGFKSGDTADLEQLRETLASFGKRRLFLWCVRWILGFAAIGLIVYFWPALTWLFWVGAAIATTSLAATLAFLGIALRRVAAGRRRIEDYERLAQMAGERTDTQGGQ